MPLSREYASAAKPALGSWVMVTDSIGDLSSQAKVGRAKSPGTPKLCRTPRRCRYSNRNCPIGMRAGNAAAFPLAACGFAPPWGFASPCCFPFLPFTGADGLSDSVIVDLDPFPRRHIGI